MSVEQLIGQFAQEWGADRVLREPDQCSFFGLDVYGEGTPPDAVLKPRSVAQWADAVARLAPYRVALIARGAGLSYTDAYQVRARPCVLFDTRDLDQTIEVHPEDGYVVVDAGVRWAQLEQALLGFGVRTPFWGPLSGLHATVGGSLSQGSTFLGSAQFGAAAESVLGLEVILADGQTLRTGIWGAGAAPFLRHFGPDLTGLFLGDAGSLAFKARISLRLIPRPTHTGFLSFECESFDHLARAASVLARSQQASEIFGFDPVLTEKRMRRASLLSDVKTLGSVVRAQGVVEGLRLAVAGRRFVDPQKHSLHACFDADSKAMLDERLNLWRATLRCHGRELESAIPRVLRSQPFVPPNSILGPDGERWVPVHGIVAHSEAEPAQKALDEMLKQHAADLQRYRIDVGFLYTMVGAQGFLIEPVFYWPDARSAFHERVVERSMLERVPRHPVAPEARALVHTLKRAMSDALEQFGASHFQLGKFYPYRHRLLPAGRMLFDAVKQALDPYGVMNPGALN